MKKHLVAFVATCLTLSFSASAQDAWSAKWINTENCQSKTNTWLCFRKQINLKDIPNVLNARIAADSKYWLWINDSLVVFEGGLKRGPNPTDTYFDEVDIAPYLKQDDNVIAVLVWHFGKNGFSHVNSGRAALLFDCNAPGINLDSDKSWSCAVYPAYETADAPFPNFRLSESSIRFDANKEMVDWYKSSYNGYLPGALEVAEAEGYPFGKLHKRIIPQWKNSGLVDYVSVRYAPQGDTIYCKLPYNCHVTPYLKVSSVNGGDTIVMKTDHYDGGSDINVCAKYITTKGTREYESLGWMNGHEVMYIVPKGAKVEAVKYRETGYNADFTGSFECDDPFYNTLWQKAARTLYVTMRDSYMDCPDRERAQWWGDEVNELGETFYALDPRGQRLALKGIYELMNWQRADGTLFSPVPSVNWGKELPLQMLASVGYYGFYTQYFYSGDSTFVEPIYDGLHRYLHEVWQVDAAGLPIVRYGEWSWGDWGDNVDLEVLTAAWYYLALKAEREFAVMTGRTADAAQNESMMRRLEEAFNAKYWNGNVYRSPSYTGQTDDRAQAMAVVSGLASTEKYEQLKACLRKEFHASPYMEKYVLEALFLMGDTDYALERMRNRYEEQVNYPVCTTLWEGWGIGANGFGGGTMNHAWSGGPLTLLSQYVCGIEPVSAGFETFRIKPQLGTLNEVKATVHSVNGFIRMSARKAGRKLLVDVSVPDGCKAEVVLPHGYVFSKYPKRVLSKSKDTMLLPGGTYQLVSTR
ncbi:MAG: alpha-L-rhamnosidase C-terminal domain-containing protein [Tannerellaceae bacterium]